MGKKKHLEVYKRLWKLLNELNDEGVSYEITAFAMQVVLNEMFMTAIKAQNASDESEAPHA